MASATEVQATAVAARLVAFRLDGDLYGVEVAHVQEVLRSHRLAAVPLAPPAVAGLINLRGQVVTAIDLRKRLARPPRPAGEDPIAVVIRVDGEVVSLLVDSIVDVVEVDHRTFESPPDTLSGPARVLIRGAYKLESRLLLALDVQRAVEVG